MQVRAIHHWLEEKIAQCEKFFGPIATDEEIERRAKGGHRR